MAGTPGLFQRLAFPAMAVALMVQYWIVLTDQFENINRGAGHLALLMAVFVLYLATMQARDWAQLAAPAGFMAAALVTAALGSVTGHTTIWNGVVLLMLVIHAAPAPLVRPSEARIVLGLVAVTPVALAAVQLFVVDGPSLGELVRGERFAFGGAAPHAAAALLLSVVASTVLIRTGSRWARVAQLLVFIPLALTGARLYTGIAVVFGLATVGLDLRRRGHAGDGRATAFVRAAWPWAVLVVLAMWRTAIRTVETAGDDTVAGVPLSGRGFFWREYIEHGASDMLTGGGFGRIQQLQAQGVANSWAPHNEYLQLLIEVGIVGLLLVAVGVAITWTARYRRLPSDSRWAYGVPILLLPIAAALEPALRTLQLTMPLAVVMAAIASLDRDEPPRSVGTLATQDRRDGL